MRLVIIVFAMTASSVGAWCPEWNDRWKFYLNPPRRCDGCEETALNCCIMMDTCDHAQCPIGQEVKPLAHTLVCNGEKCSECDYGTCCKMKPPPLTLAPTPFPTPAPTPAPTPPPPPPPTLPPCVHCPSQCREQGAQSFSGGAWQLDPDCTGTIAQTKCAAGYNLVRGELFFQSEKGSSYKYKCFPAHCPTPKTCADYDCGNRWMKKVGNLDSSCDDEDCKETCCQKPQCWARGMSWVPALKKIPSVDTPELCEKTCSLADDCAHFTWFADGTCTLSGDYSKPTANAQSTISGPPTCEDVDMDQVHGSVVSLGDIHA